MRYPIRKNCKVILAAVASAALALSLAVDPGCATAGMTEATVSSGASPVAPTPCAEAPLCKPAMDPIEARVEAWLAAMTLDEKLALVAGTGFDSVGVPRLHIPSLRMTDGPIGVRVGQATEFPASILLAASFDPALAERIGAAIARETKAHGKNVILGPAVNIVRTPLDGRDFEYLGEDPALAAGMAVGYIRGVQSQGVVATVKHFAANNQETERKDIDVELDDRTLHEIYLPAFEAAVKEAGVWAVMCAYNKVGGAFACENPRLLDGILRRDWGFRGLVMSDWGATHDLLPAVHAGMDLEMPSALVYQPAAMRAALEQKTITSGALDDLVRRQLRVIAALHLDEDATVRAEGTDTLEHRALNRVAAREGFVLLKNEHGILPLDASKLRRIAVVGPRGDHLDGGGGSAHVSATRQVTLVQALRQALGSKVRVDYAPGEITLDGLAAIPPSALTPPAGHAGQGLLGEYFPNRSHAGAPKLSRVDPTVNFHWELSAPAPEFPEDNFSVRWSGKLVPPKSGLYMLAVRSDDGARLYLDGKLLVDNWGDHPPTLKTTEIPLVGGKAYQIRLDYYEAIIGASVELLWQRAERDPLGKIAETARGADVVIAAVGDGMGDETEGQDRPSLALPGRQDEIVRAAAVCQSPTDRRDDHGRGGGHALARQGESGAARVVPRTRGRHGDGRRVAWRDQSIGQAARDLPEASGRRGVVRQLSRRAGQGALPRRDPGRLSLVRHPQAGTVVPVRVWALVHPLRLSRPRGVSVGCAAGRDRAIHREEHRSEARSRGRTGLRACARRERTPRRARASRLCPRRSGQGRRANHRGATADASLRVLRRNPARRPCLASRPRDVRAARRRLFSRRPAASDGERAGEVAHPAAPRSR